MSRIAATRTIWILIASCGIWLASAGHCMALTWYWGAHPDKERLVLVLDRPADGYTLERTGKQTLTLTLPASAANEAAQIRQQAGSKGLGSAKLLGKPIGKGRTLSIPVRTAAFGYISTAVSGNKIVVDLFSDPIGARWKPRKNAPKAEPVVTPPKQSATKTTATKAPAAEATKEKPLAQITAKSEQPVWSELPVFQKPVTSSRQQDSTVKRPTSIVEKPGARSLAPVLPRPLAEKTLDEPLPETVPQEPDAGNAAPADAPPAETGTPSAIPSTAATPTETGTRSVTPSKVVTPLVIATDTSSAESIPKVSTPPERSFFAVPYTYRSMINKGGPADWKEPSRASAPVVASTSTPNADGSIRARVSKTPQGMNEDTSRQVPQEAVDMARKIQAAKDQQVRDQAEKAARAEAERQIQAEANLIAKEKAKNGGAQKAPATPAENTVTKDETAGTIPVAQSPAAQSPAAQTKGPDNAVRAKIAQPGQVATVRRAPDSKSDNTPASMLSSVASQQADVKVPVPDIKPSTPALPKESGADRFIVSAQAPPAPAYPELKTELVNAEPKVKVEPIEVPKPQLEPVVSNIPAPPEPKVVYVDKNGNPIPPPPDPKDLIFQAQTALNNGNAAAALEQFNTIKRIPKLTEEQRAEVLNGIADTAYALGKDDLLANYEKIIQASTEAMNFNLKASSVPGHLLRIGMTNMKIGNDREAEAYFNILRKNYPNSDLIPLTYYYWGDHYFNKGEWQKAADNYQYVVQNYPDSKFVREAGVGLARALYSLGFYDQAFQIVDYVEKRWPRFYVEYPPFLSQMGDVEYRMKKYDKARITYWTYYNIDPDGDEADMILSRLGDLYLEQREKDAAREVYEECARKFPDRDGGLIALMRLAEEGVFDSPSITEMSSVFERPYNLRPLQIYSKIIEDHPDSGLVPLARLKKSMWYLWDKQYPEALTTATSFMKNHPGHELTSRVKEVALKAFNVMVADNIREGNYERILQIWDQFPIVRGQDTELAPESRIALGLAYWKKGQPTKALEVIDPFFLGLKVPEQSEMALNLALSIYLENERWADVIKLGQRIEEWDLNPESQRQLSYALALAHENLGEHALATPIWASLSDAKDVPLDQEAYTLYFLSREAERKEEWETAFRHAQQSLTDFREIAKRNPEKADSQKIKDLLGSLMDITERTGRIKDSLGWAQQYADTVKATDPDYPGLQYRIAGLYKKNADLEKWRSIMEKLRDGSPNSLYGRMAASELRTYDLTEGASKFSPTGRL